MKLPADIQALAQKIRDAKKNNLTDLHSLGKPLYKGLWVLAEALDVGTSDLLTCNEIKSLLEELGVASSVYSLSSALGKAGDKVIRRPTPDGKGYKIAQPGRDSLRDVIGPGGIEVWYAEQGRPWTAKKKLADVAQSVRGDLLITDPYYGERTLPSLYEFADRPGKVRFITCETNENTAKLAASFHDLMKEKANIEVRIFPNKGDIHDRYVLGDDALVLVGHGFKDLGGKESFVVRLSDAIAKDIMDTVRAVFEDRWAKSAKV